MCRSGGAVPSDRTATGPKILTGDGFDLILSDGGDSLRSFSIDVQIRDGLKISQLVPKIGHAVVFEHQPCAELVSGFCELTLRNTGSRDSVQRSGRGALDVVERNPFDGRG